MNKWFGKKGGVKGKIAANEPKVHSDFDVKKFFKMNFLPILFLIYSVVIIVIVLLLLTGQSGDTTGTTSGNSDSVKFLGTWTEEGGAVFTFYSNKSLYTFETITNNGISNDVSTWGTWEILSNKKILIDMAGFPITYDYVFSNNNKKITITFEQMSFVLTK